MQTWTGSWTLVPPDGVPGEIHFDYVTTPTQFPNPQKCFLIRLEISGPHKVCIDDHNLGTDVNIESSPIRSNDEYEDGDFVYIALPDWDRMDSPMLKLAFCGTPPNSNSVTVYVEASCD